MGDHRTGVQRVGLPERFPDFIIAGAMKSGTSSLHHMLAQHPDIFIPDREIHFFVSVHGIWTIPDSWVRERPACPDVGVSPHLSSPAGGGQVGGLNDYCGITV
jgi:hypothetical protein